MELINNKSEGFYREIRNIEVYRSDSLTFKENMAGTFPNESNMLYKFPVNAEDYERKIPTKLRSGNTFFDVDLNFPLLNLKKENRDKFYQQFNKRGFVVVLNSNTEKMVLGNKIEPLSIDFIDGMKDNASGSDQFNISITGETMIPPKIV